MDAFSPAHFIVLRIRFSFQARTNKKRHFPWAGIKKATIFKNLFLLQVRLSTTKKVWDVKRKKIFFVVVVTWMDKSGFPCFANLYTAFIAFTFLLLHFWLKGESERKKAFFIYLYRKTKKQKPKFWTEKKAFALVENWFGNSSNKNSFLMERIAFQTLSLANVSIWETAPFNWLLCTWCQIGSNVINRLSFCSLISIITNKLSGYKYIGKFGENTYWKKPFHTTLSLYTCNSIICRIYKESSFPYLYAYMTT